MTGNHISIFARRHFMQGESRRLRHIDKAGIAMNHDRGYRVFYKVIDIVEWLRSDIEPTNEYRSGIGALGIICFIPPTKKNRFFVTHVTAIRVPHKLCYLHNSI